MKPVPHAGPLYRITAPHFCAGFVFGVYYAPILGYMRHWPLLRIRAVCARRHWKFEEIPPN